MHGDNEMAGGLLRHFRINAIAAIIDTEVVVIATGSRTAPLIEANGPQFSAKKSTSGFAVSGLIEGQAGTGDEKKKSDLFKHDILFAIMAKK
ncbi:hypothetical protein ACL9RI_19960 [Janthinobacterium sp. Mn2066]|uniref:hypothetical protein n=1 Tax=Janthinobacterium sp. Mn2066 TaxID=3395264 RepID=UPI003BEEA214